MTYCPLSIRSVLLILLTIGLLVNKPEAQSRLGEETHEKFVFATKTYANYLHGFFIDFPDRWELDRGAQKHTVIRGIEKDSGITFFVNVQNIEESDQSKITLWDLYDSDPKAFKNLMLNNMRQINDEISDITINKLYIKNRKAIRISTQYVLRDLDLEYDVIAKFYHVLREGKYYIIGFHCPQLYYTENRFIRILNSFSFTS